MKHISITFLITFFCLNGFAQIFNIPVLLSGGSGNNGNEICGSNTITLTADPIPAGMTYEWVVYAGACQSGPNEIVLSAGSGVISYGGTGEVYCHALDSAGIIQGISWPIPIVNPDNNGGICDTANTGGSVTVCNGSFARLQCSQDITWSDYINTMGSPDTVLQWQLNGVDIPGAINNPVFNATSSGSYRAKFMLYCGVNYSNAVQVTVSPPLTVAVTGNNIICDGATAMICANGGYTCYIWSNGSTAQCISVNASGNYYVVVCDANGCTGTGSASVVTLPLPTPQITTNDSTLCQTQSTVLDAGSGYASYLWATGANTQVISVNVIATYTVTVTDANGCTGSDTITLSSEPPYPTVITASGSVNMCQGDSVLLHGPAGQVFYQWKKNNVNIPGATGVNYWAKLPGRYTCNTLDNTGCTGLSNQIRVRIVCIPPVSNGERISETTDELGVYPNPASESIYIQIPDNTTGPFEISLIDFTGRKILSKSENSNEVSISLNGIAPGYYFVEVRTINSQLVQPLLVEQ